MDEIDDPVRSRPAIAWRWCGFCGAKEAFSPEVKALLRFPVLDTCPRCGELDWRSEIDEITAADFREV